MMCVQMLHVLLTCAAAADAVCADVAWLTCAVAVYAEAACDVDVC